MAVGQGFEPWDLLQSTVFKTAAFDHSATPPERDANYTEVFLRINHKTTIYTEFFHINHCFKV